MSYINRRNRRGRFGRSIDQRFNSVPPRRNIGINPHNSSLYRIRRRRLQATKRSLLNSIRRNRLLGYFQHYFSIFFYIFLLFSPMLNLITSN